MRARPGLQEIQGGRRPWHGADEILASDHVDQITVQSVNGPCHVLTFAQYQSLSRQTGGAGEAPVAAAVAVSAAGPPPAAKTAAGATGAPGVGSTPAAADTPRASGAASAPITTGVPGATGDPEAALAPEKDTRYLSIPADEEVFYCREQYDSKHKVIRVRRQVKRGCAAIVASRACRRTHWRVCGRHGLT